MYYSLKLFIPSIFFFLVFIYSLPHPKHARMEKCGATPTGIIIYLRAIRNILLELGNRLRLLSICYGYVTLNYVKRRGMDVKYYIIMDINCKQCEIVFNGRSDAKFCSARCKMAWHRQTKEEKSNIKSDAKHHLSTNKIDYD